MIHVPNLKHVGGELNVMGNQEINESHLPSLETINGDLIIAKSGFKKLPPKLNHIGGRVIISKSDPQSLVNDLIRAAEKGMIKGGIYYCD
jgi:hypothetical protein